MGTNPRRIEQIKSLIASELSDFLLKHNQDNADYSVFDIVLNPDLKEAKVLITTTALLENKTNLEHELQQLANQFSKHLFKKTALKRSIKFTILLSDSSVFDNLEI